ncbi:hypothetical protein [Micromonospora cathayae]|uniref:Mannosyl-glycoprotein endo-beta-N-acetylglucosaminidase n=1 Tax=Micromonospora cathayae TaxID=3028804 RepID=A0ABY7ZMS2_9ACTN|nr:hypothetical protein [Micromonospora sp. HUAS 3]WDZ83199.1 hypothetical protein PVK37_22440 [Micromonospora sp. HUAS 3]
MQQHLTRWLPAIAKTSYRRAVLSVAGVAVLGGLAVGPAAYAGQVTGTPHPDAVAAIALATGTTTAVPAVQAGPVTTERPDPDRLVPHGVQGVQSRIPLDDAQLDNAREIVETARETGVGERGAVIGVATALQESKLYNLGHLGAYNDHDSQGLFQQRPSSGWGTPDQVTDPEYASTAFFEALKRVDGWQQAPLTVAAQTVQVSAYPFAYAQWEEQAAEIVQQVW